MYERGSRIKEDWKSSGKQEQRERCRAIWSVDTQDCNMKLDYLTQNKAFIQIKIIESITDDEMTTLH